MLSMIERGLPIATELLQPMAAGYFDDLLAWAAIGARTTESQIHREMVSGLELPVGFKNGTDGGIAIACDAMRSAAHPHRHFGMDAQGHPAIIEAWATRTPTWCCAAATKGPNYDAHSIAQARQALAKPACSHGSWSIAAMPTAARTRCASRRCSRCAAAAPGRRPLAGRRDDRRPPVRRLPGAGAAPEVRRVDHRRLPGLGSTETCCAKRHNV
jgi:3-deoxy-7-phosphoheptulonate synthase